MVKWSKWKDEEVGICCSSIRERSYVVKNRYIFFFFYQISDLILQTRKIGWKTLSLRISIRERLKGIYRDKERREEGRKEKKRKEKKGKEETRDIFEVPISPFIRSSQMERGK